MQNFLTSEDDNKRRKTDRIIVLEQISKDKHADTGMVDTSLFKGGNQLHARQDSRTLFWTLHMEKGDVPGALKKQRFTTFKHLLDFVRNYFERRNARIVEIKD